jgi:hypothetical protein
MNTLISNQAFVARSLILLLMFCEWAFLIFYGPYIVRQSAGNVVRTLVIRASCAFGIIGVIWIQGTLNRVHKASPGGTHNAFLKGVFLIESLVGICLVLFAAFKARSR